MGGAEVEWPFFSILVWLLCIARNKKRAIIYYTQELHMVSTLYRLVSVPIATHIFLSGIASTAPDL